jgi:hypothetical protein
VTEGRVRTRGADRRMTRALLVGCLATGALWSSRAGAQPTGNEVRAQALFEAAKQLRDAGQVADACPMFAESKELAPGVGITLYLADCYERAGRPASALDQFRQAETLARERGDDKRAAVAHERARALEPRLEHPAPAASPAPLPPPVDAAPAPAAPAPPAESPGGESARLWLGLGLVAAGAAGAGLGVFFLAKRGQLMNDRGPCDTPQNEDDTATAATIAFAAGGAALVSALVLYVSAPGPAAARTQVGWLVTPAPMPGGGGAVVRARF